MVSDFEVRISCAFSAICMMFILREERAVKTLSASVPFLAGSLMGSYLFRAP